MGDRSDEWYAGMTELMTEHVGPMSDHYWSTRSLADEAMREVRMIRKLGYDAFITQFRSFAAGHARNFRGPQRTSAHAAIEEEIHTRLGLWLCSYFLGFPLPHLWEPVRHLQSVLEGYTGIDALYAKLAGDVYRAERKSRARALHEDKTSEAGEPRPEGVLVLAFSPTMLLAYEELPTLDDPPVGGMTAERARFLVVVNRLAREYLRLQMWLYLAAEPPNPIHYAFQVEAAAKALIKNLGIGVGSAERRAKVLDRFESIGGTPATPLYAIPGDLLLGDVFTSCTLGRDDGAITDRPQRWGTETRRSTWVRSQYLTLERAKVENLLFVQNEPDGPKEVREGLAVNGEAIEALLTAADQQAEEQHAVQLDAS